MKNLDRFKNYYESIGQETFVLNDILWIEYNKMVIPVGPVNQNYFITSQNAELLLKKFKKALMVKSTFEFDTDVKTLYYAVICDHFIHIDNMNSKYRSEIRRAFKNCYVELIDHNYILKNGYEIYRAAFNRYKNSTPISNKDFEKNIAVEKDFSDIIEYWGVFVKNSKKMIGFSKNIIYDGIEVNYGSIKLDPNYLSLYPSHALIYSMNKYYLLEKKFQYVNDGFRSLLHQSNIQEFLIKKFNFRKVYLRPIIFFRKKIAPIISFLYFFKEKMRKIDPRIDAILKIEEIRRANLII